MFSLTPEDTAYLNELSESLGFRSRSQLLTAIIERLILGGFSGVSFLKLGAQFTRILPKAPLDRSTLFDALRPLPPLIGDQLDPKLEEITPFLRTAQREIIGK